MYDFLSRFGMHCVFGSLVVISMGFNKCDSRFNLSLPFLDSHGEMGFFNLVEMDYWMVSKLSEVV